MFHNFILNLSQFDMSATMTSLVSDGILVLLYATLIDYTNCLDHAVRAHRGIYTECFLCPRSFYALVILLICQHGYCRIVT